MKFAQLFSTKLISLLVCKTLVIYTYTLLMVPIDVHVKLLWISTIHYCKSKHEHWRFSIHVKLDL